MRKLIETLIVISALILPASANAQNDIYDAFVPISKYLSQGNANALSAWFADDLDISVVSQGGNCSKVQAKQILKTFFDSYTPTSFEIIHSAGRSNMKYALGNLSAGGEKFLVTIFVSCKDNKIKIQQLKIELRR